MQSRKPPAKLPEQALFDYAVRILAGRASSSGELRLKLRRRAQNKSDVETAIVRLKDLGYLNDRKFAEAFTSTRVENGGFGQARVLQDLRIRQVAPKLAEETVLHAFAGKDEKEMVMAFIDRRMPSLAIGGQPTAGGLEKDQRKLAAGYRKLRRAGFSSSVILTVLKRLAAHPEMLEEPPPDDELEGG